MGPDSLLLFVLFFVAAAAGWFAARRFGVGKTGAARSQPVNPDYFKGLTYLLEDKPDKALEVFVAMMEVDNETVETHFALGSLFRRRGEVDRAIRIHQNVIARPNLPRRHRDQALFALAEDYLRAGLFDRAEKLFVRLLECNDLKASARLKLAGIYEQQHDWKQAIAARRDVTGVDADDNNNIIAHYQCELASEVLADGDPLTARAFLRKARVGGRRLLRAALMRAQIALAEDDNKTAARLFTKVAEQKPGFIVEVWKPLKQSLAGGSDRANFATMLENLLQKHPYARDDIAYAAIVHNDIDTDCAARSVTAFIRDCAPLREAMVKLGALDPAQTSVPGNLSSLAAALRELLRNRSAYLCHECGYASDQLYWQCPSCKNWDAIEPNSHIPTDRLALTAGR